LPPVTAFHVQLRVETQRRCDCTAWW